MLKEYFFRVTTEKFESVCAKNEQEAYELMQANYEGDDELVSIDLMDYYDGNPDDDYEDYKLFGDE